MNEINNNPYRILGICSNANDKTIQKQISSFRRYIEVDKIISSDVDFAMLLGQLERNQEQIDDANRKLERSEDKIFYSLFWFIQITEADREAISIMNTDFQKAKSIWEKSIEDSYMNYSAFTNLSNLYLIEAFQQKEINKNSLEEAIVLKGHLFASEYFETYKNQIINENEKIDVIELFNRFSDSIYENLGTNDTDFYHAFIYTYFSNYTFEMKEYVKQKVVSNELLSIEKLINEHEEKKKSTSCNNLIIGEQLFNDTIGYINVLRGVLFDNEVALLNISDRLSENILQCGIDHWNQELNKNNEKQCRKALELVGRAQSISLPGRVADRIEKELKTMQDSVNNVGTSTNSDDSDTSAWKIIGWIIVIIIVLVRACS